MLQVFHIKCHRFQLIYIQVQKQSGQNLLALKEVNLHNPAFGKDKKSRDSNVEKIMSELTIVKEQAQSFNFNQWKSI